MFNMGTSYLNLKFKLKINKYGMYVKLVLGLHSLQVQ